MLFALSKLIWIILRPANFFVAALIGYFLLSWLGWKKLARGILVPAFLVFFAAGFTNLSDYMMQYLEDWYGANVVPQNPAGIIVLGGGLNSGLVTQNGGYELENGADRIIAGFELQNRFPGLPVVYSGDAPAVFHKFIPEAEVARRVAIALYGNDRGWIYENQSRNTWENAIEVKRALEARGFKVSGAGYWILVSSAFHMPRAMASFTKAGFSVVPWKTDYRARRINYPRITFNSAVQLKKTELALKEYIGLVVYKWMGRI